MSAGKLASVLYLFPHPVADVVAEVQAGVAPTERLYGLIELRQSGYPVDYCDSRFEGIAGRLHSLLRPYGVFLLNWRSIREIMRHDVVIVKDDFSVLTTLVAKLLGKRIIYLDSMFKLPTRSWRRVLTKLTIAAADTVFCYSKRQIALWSRELNVAPTKFTFLPYTIDSNFYIPVKPELVRVPYALSVGRDLGRDFATLVEAVRGTGLRLKLVTLPYLLPPGAAGEAFIDVYERVSYSELFALYANSTIVVVPLSEALLYPSGIRAVFESALLERVAIATFTPILEEYVADGMEIIYVKAKDVQELRTAITALAGDPARRDALQQRAKRRVVREYRMETLKERLITVIEGTKRMSDPRDN